MKKEVKKYWYNDSKLINSIIIGIVVLIILLSQSFAINNNLSAVNIFRDIINHNFNYVLVLIYFIALKTYSGKKYFNYLNLFLVFIYTISTVTSFLSVFQTLSIINLLTLSIRLVTLIYLVHTMFRDTRYWSEFKINKSPFNDISSDSYFSCLIVLASVLLAFNLIFVKSADGAIISILDSLYVMFVGRYIYLYREYLEFKTLLKLKEKQSKGDRK